MSSYKGKLTTAILITTLTGSLLTGCMSGNQQAATPQPKTPATETTAGFKNGKFDPPITITTIGCEGGALKFRNGETYENNGHTKWMKDNLGIIVKYQWVAPTFKDCSTKLRLAISANEPLPDIIPVNAGEAVTLNMLIESGKAMDISKAVEQYASPELKRVLGEVPNVWAMFSKDGKKYGFPHFNSAYQNDPALWFRADWLQKFNLQAPKTIDDLDKIFDAFVNQDPDGNGKKDTLGMAMSMNIVDYMSDSSWVFGAYGAIPKYWYPDKSGNLVYGSIQPEIKNGLAKLNDWFKKGYISKEFGLQDANKSVELLSKGTAGMAGGPFWLGDWPLTDALKVLPESAKFQAFPIPVGPNGKAMRQTNNIVANGVVFNKDFKHMDAFMLYWNRMFEGANPKQGSEFEHGWLEGYDHVMKDGKPDTVNVPGGVFQIKGYTLMTQFPNDPYLEVPSLAKLASGTKPTTPFEARADGRRQIRKDGAAVVMTQKDIGVRNYYQGPLTKTMEQNNEMLTKLETETFLKIIYGELPLSEFDKFVENWKKSGGDQINKEVNDWYKAQK